MPDRVRKTAALGGFEGFGRSVRSVFLATDVQKIARNPHRVIECLQKA